MIVGEHLLHYLLSRLDAFLAHEVEIDILSSRRKRFAVFPQEIAQAVLSLCSVAVFHPVGIRTLRIGSDDFHLVARVELI